MGSVYWFTGLSGRMILYIPAYWFAANVVWGRCLPTAAVVVEAVHLVSVWCWSVCTPQI